VIYFRLPVLLVLLSIMLFPTFTANADNSKNELVVDISNVWGSSKPVSGSVDSKTLSAESEGILQFPGTKVTADALPVDSTSNSAGLDSNTDADSTSPSLTADEDAVGIISFPESRVKSDTPKVKRSGNSDNDATNDDLTIPQDVANPDIIIGETQFSQEESNFNRGLIFAFGLLGIIPLFALLRKQ
jgi:hypothetical protein